MKCFIFNRFYGLKHLTWEIPSENWQDLLSALKVLDRSEHILREDEVSSERELNHCCKSTANSRDKETRRRADESSFIWKS
jgi:hypothetical protein